MASEQDSKKQELLTKLNDYLESKLPKRKARLVAAFAQRYYALSSYNDLRERSIENLFGALMSHWECVYQRSPGESKVHIFNPTQEKDGWQSKYTIIEISHDDMPFLVDTVRMEINRCELQIHFLIHFGGLKVKRNELHQITEIVPLGAMDPHASSEAPIYIEIDRMIDENEMKSLCEAIKRVLGDVQIAVIDWRKMVDRVEEILSELDQNPPPLDPAELVETRDFLQWLINNHFTFLGARDYKLIGNNSNRALMIVPHSGLGVLRDDTDTPISKSYSELPPQARKIALSKNILIIAKTNKRSTVHRDAYTDYIGIKHFNEKGELIGERRFIGLYTSTAYHSSPRYIPFLRHKVAKVLQELHFPPDSHNGKEAVHILETLPRDDLFQATHEELVNLTMGILQLQERKRIRLFVRKDAYSRYYSCLVYVPREIFTTDLCLAMQEVLIEAFQGIEANFIPYFSDSVLARIHYTVRVNPKRPIEYDPDKLEKRLVAVARSWTDELKTHLIAQFGDINGLVYFNKYRKAFPSSYTEYYLPAVAIEDIHKIEILSETHPLEMTFYKSGISALRLKLFHAEHTIALSDVLPTLENMGLKIISERPHEILFKNGNIIWINDFDMVYTKNKHVDIENIKDIFHDSFTHIWFKDAENDGFNQLVLEAQLWWREIAILRAYTKYLRQVGFTFSQDYIQNALINNAEITKKLIELFKLRFSPDIKQSNETITAFVKEIETAFDNVASLDEDRILRRLLEVILATLRTNYFQKNSNNEYKNYLSLKFDPAAISDLPLPKPKYEIFVYSPQVEGVHLRGGKVARGGIRWSDRREDFRTEILGLMKAQQVKNSVIVPVGAKGGFYPKQLPEGGDRDAILREGIASYSTFIRGLLDITDNIVEKQIVHPLDVIRYDEDDPYLVVAADKGTATFSDIANGISMSYDFWLGDAFASGGSAGYDHKKMGITARGAWESVKRHFRELGINTQETDFTVVGIGDMAGDVFGNGMLLSQHIKLIAVFNHVHIFTDPNPDPEVSFEERKRLFNLPRSTWMDYDSSVISEGGGVYNRSAKSIKISPELKKALNLKKDVMVPNELIKAILKAPVDLLWNGGIGTFVKSSQESHLDAGDRTNDGIRVDGNEISARVVGEGGNLGFTQLARVEYSLNGGIMYTDFVDNSAGVDCSDHEVNIKILLNKVVSDGKLTLKQRNALLERMTDEIAVLVIRDNYEQTQIVSLETTVVLENMALFSRYLNELEKNSRIDRKLEFLPDDKTLLERKANGQGLTRPEIAILIAYCKIYLKQEIMASDLPEDPYFIRHLMTAFPKILCKRYLPELKEHSLRREIIATQLAKTVTDCMGINFIERLHRETGAPPAVVLRAYSIAAGIYDLDGIWQQIEGLDYTVSPLIQQKMMLSIFYLVRRATRWFVKNRKADVNIEDSINEFTKPIDELIKNLPRLLAPADLEILETEIDSLISENVPEVLARRIACCHTLFTSLDIVEGTQKSKVKLLDMAKVYYSLGSLLELNWLRDQMNAYSIDNQWDELARSGYRDDLDKAQRKLSISALSLKIKTQDFGGHIHVWLDENKELMTRWQNLIADIKSSTNIAFVTYSVVMRELFDFAQA
jgi:glutamate dehydrogenase